MASADTAQGLCPDRLARIRPAMQGYVDRDQYAGISTLISRHGQIVHCDQVGFADKETATPMAHDTLFRVYSMTKPIAAATLMTLHEEGRFQLFDPLSKHIPAFESLQVLEGDAAGNQRRVAPQRPPTVRDLLTHTAGFTYQFCEGTPVAGLYGDAQVMLNDVPLADAIAELASLPLVMHPGTKWHYDVNIDVAAYLAQVLADQPFDELVHDRLLAPLGMEDTHFCVPAGKRSRVATTYGVADIAEPDYNLGKILGVKFIKKTISFLDLKAVKAK